MAGYAGDFRLGDTLDIKFTTVATTGAPTTLAGTPSVAAYPGNSTTEVTAGITLSVDFDSRTGLHNVRVVASGGNGYATATNYSLVITAGTVGGTSVVGYEVGSFSIENRSAVMPTTAARTLDVSATGEAGVDWANVGSPTTSLALTGTTIAVTQKVDVDTIKTNPVVNGGTITFPTTATLASTTNITAGTVTTATNLTNAPTAGDFTAVMKTSIGTAVAASAVASVTARVTANTDQLAGQTVTAAAGVTFPTSVASPTNITAGTITTATNLTNAPTAGDFTATMKTSIGTAVAASAVASVTAGVTVTTNNDKTGYSIASGGIGSGAHAAAELNAIADALLDRNMATGADNGTDSTVVRTVRQALRRLRNKEAIAAGTGTIYKENDSTASWTYAAATTAGDPLSSVDPT